VAARLSVPGRTDLPGPGLSVMARVVPRDAAEPARAGARRAFLDADRLGTDLMVRTRLPGDLFHPLGAPGRRKLKQFLIDRGVPRALRDRLVLVVGPEGVAWVAGVEIGHPYRVRDSTVRVAVLELEGAGGADVESRESGV
jgi:tRNA(Ile)-lysidine synthase